jgi:hypothetical protein
MRNTAWFLGSISALALLAACDDDDGSGVGTSCSSAEQCYLDLEEEVQGDPVCLDRVEGGYCSHECATDDDCCTVEGECANGRRPGEP